MKYFDGVGQVTATTGTGTMTLGATIDTSFFKFSEQGAVDTDQVYYRIDEGGNVEIGIGTIGGSVTTLSRDTVLKSRVSGSAGTGKMNLAGAAQVRCVSASQALNALVLTAAQTLSQSEQAQARANIGANLLGGFRNKLINALGTINQRAYVSGAATSGANQYTLDRWRVVTSGQNLSWTESEGVRTMTAPAGGVEQVIEGSCIISGDYVLNWSGTATATVGGVARTKGEVFSLTGGSNVTVRFTGGTFSLPQLEQGSSPTQFEARHVQQELALCQRYLEAWHNNSVNIPLHPQANDTYTTIAFWEWIFSVTKRVVPTIAGHTFVGVSSGTVLSSTTGARFGGTSTGSSTVSGNFTADAEL